MHYKKGGYSYLIRPILMVLDISVLLGAAYYLLPDLVSKPFYVFLGISWFVIANILDFYHVYRFTKVVKIISLLLKQGVFLLVTIFAFIGVLRISTFESQSILLYTGSVMLLTGTLKVFSYYALRKYRSYLGGNNRNVMIVGNNKGAQQLYSFFTKHKEMGYKVMGVFGDGLPNSVEESFEFLEKEYIDEIYCSLEEITDDEVNTFVKYADQNNSILKFIPKSQYVYSKKLKTDYYEYLPVLSIPEVSLNNATNRAVKRGFDIVFSFLVIVLILSWLIPILYILIKLESSGPLIYSHKRNGINYKEFICYKFRSMKHASHSDHEVKKNDDRVTNIGRFLRRTSLDELPQFFNVFFGDMSVVGPRPHMPKYTKDYAKKIDKYNYVFRHSVKPGITGLAQVSGYRGEIKNDEDIVNRIKYDIFYIENWSLILDLKIIFETIINIIKGEDKAY